MRALFALLFCSLLVAQEKTPPAAPESTAGYEAAIIPVKTLTGDSFQRLADMLMVFQVRYKADPQMRTIVAYGPKHIVAEMRRVVEQLDQPGSQAALGRNIEMTLSFLRCWTTPNADGPELPTDLEAVAKQLRAVTQYKRIELWDIVPLRIQEGKVTNQKLQLPEIKPNQQPLPQATIQIRPEAVTRKENGRYVRFGGLSVNFRIPYTVGPRESMLHQVFEGGLDTSGEFKEGQKTVLGKVSGIDAESAVFVVVSLKVLD